MLMRIFFFFFFFFLIHFVTSISNQEDLSISKYSHIGCLILNSDTQFIFNYIQENFLSPYQTFSSSNMSIELCFRLCRRWIILMNNNHTNCICLYTINELYQMNEYLGEILSINNCTSNALQIYSLTKDPYLLPSLSSNDDWSLEGCYYLHGIQSYHGDLSLKDVNYTQAIDLCRKNCQLIRNSTYFSFFLSFKKICYCLPIKLLPLIIPTAVRKPLIHCSFISYIKNGFENSLNYSEINIDTVVKINVHRYCSSSFIFYRNLYLCLKIVSLDTFNSYSKISPNEICLPVLIKTYEQWNHLISSSFLLRSRTFIWIDRNSTYIFDDLFKSKVNSLISNDFCLVVNRARSTPFDLIPCSTVYSPGYIFCTQKPMETNVSDQAEFKSIQNEKQFSIVNNFSCPTNFILFNNICYYIDTSFVYNIPHGEQFCSNKYSNSTLVKFNSHEWGNINSTRFLGRKLDDILLEFFYYQLEKKFIIETKNNTNRKHWLRLLIGDKNNYNECTLRYFTRSSGAFTGVHQCNHGGHPVCQCQPILINEIKKEIDITTESSTREITVPSTREITVSSTTDITVSKSTSLPIVSNETILPIGDNGTNLPPDEDLNNETSTAFISNHNSTLMQSKTSRSNYRPLLMIITGLLLALIILLISIVFLIRYVRRSHGSYSTSSNRIGLFHRRKRSSTPATSNDTSNTPAVLYSRLKSAPPSIIIDADMTNPLDNSITNDDNVQLLPQSINQTSLHENIPIENDEEEPFYATLKLPNEK